MDVNAAGKNQQAGGVIGRGIVVDNLAGDRLNATGLDLDICHVIIDGGDDAAAFDQHWGHGIAPNFNKRMGDTRERKSKDCGIA